MVKIGVLTEYDEFLIDLDDLSDTDIQIFKLFTERGKGFSFKTSNRVGLIKTKGTVGMIQLSTQVLKIEPKIKRFSPYIIPMLLLTNQIRMDDVYEYYTDGLDSIFEFIVREFVLRVKQIQKNRIKHDYTSVESIETKITGQLHILDTYVTSAGLFHKFAVSKDEYSSNVLENKIILTMLKYLQHFDVSEALGTELLLATEYFTSVATTTKIDGDLLSEVRYNRDNWYYEPAITFAKFILNNTYNSNLSVGSLPVPSFVISMPHLIEKLIEKLLRFELESQGITVKSQDKIPIKTSSKMEIMIKPDLTLYYDGKILPIDIKYKVYDEEKPPNADIYQGFFSASMHIGQAVILQMMDLEDTILTFNGSLHQVKINIFCFDVVQAMKERMEGKNDYIVTFSKKLKRLIIEHE